MLRFIFGGLVLLGLGGCVSPQSQQSPIRYVEFNSAGQLVEVDRVGPHTIACQDYWQRFTLWDHAVVWPSDMSSEDANAICRSREQMALETGPVQGWQAATGSVERGHANDALVRDEANASARDFDVRAR